MAGESPDRSKQRESSAGPTSGSAGPVPEARDPRMAVAREGTDGAESRGGVDTATRVLSLPPLERSRGWGRTASADDSAGKSDSESSDDSEAPEGSEDGDEATEGAGGAAAGAEGAQEDVEGAAGGDEPEAEGVSEAEAPEESAEADDDESETREDDAGADGDSEAPDWAAGADEEAQDAEDGDTDSSDEADAGSSAEEDRKATGAGAASSAEKRPEATRTSAGNPTGQNPETTRTSTGNPTGQNPETTRTSTGNPTEEDRAAAAADKGAPAEDGPEATGADEADSTDPAHPEAEADTDGPEDRSDAAEGGDGGREAAVADEDAAEGGRRAPSWADRGEPVDSPVDQPTAVFKAVRPKPAVDQPTTMLKLGTAAKATRDAESASAKAGAEPETGAGAKPEGGAGVADKAEAPGRGRPGSAGQATPEPDVAAERTSRFVALKPLDDPSTRKPVAGNGAAPAEATAVVPQVGPERTTQQPLPPKPPLDLLAELTNTPPPPPTPLRTLARRIKIWTPLVVLLAIIFAVVQSLRPIPQPTLDLTATSDYTFDGSKVDIPWPSSGQAALDVQGIGTFGSSGEEKPVPIASVAKVMTAYLILRDHPLKSGADGPEIAIDQAAEDQSDAGDESTVDVFAGDSLSQREALEGVLIASANNVARLLARWDAGSEKAFVAKMNDAARDLGMTNTTYTDPSGLTDSTVSTAVDQVKLAKAAMEEPAFREVAAMMSYTDYKGVNHSNWNHLVGTNNVVGIKTGTTTSALGNLVFAAKKKVGGETRTIVGAVVRQPAGGSDNTILGGALSASDKLIRAAQDALESATILKKGDVVGYVDDGLGGRTPVVITKDVTAVGWASLKVELSFVADMLPHSAEAGAQVGTLTVGDGGSDSAVKVPVALQKDLVEPGFMAKLTRLG